MARATTSLPVPDSPSIRTLESCAATCPMRDRTRRMAGDSPVGPRCVAISARTNSSAVDMRPASSLVFCCDSRSVAKTRRRKSDAWRQSTEDACDPALTSVAPRLPNACNLTPVTAERQFLEQVGGGFTRRHEAGLHMTVGCDIRHICDQGQRLRQAVTQPDFHQALLPHARRVG